MNMMEIFHGVLSDPYSDVLNFEECQMKKLSLVCYEIFTFFKAISSYVSLKIGYLYCDKIIRC